MNAKHASKNHFQTVVSISIPNREPMCGAYHRA
jgi:hypothetical protein